MNSASETNANFRGLQHVLSQGICVIVFYKCLRGFQILLYYDAYQFQQLVVGNGSKIFLTLTHRIFWCQLRNAWEL